jgi:hypothetical protein
MLRCQYEIPTLNHSKGAKRTMTTTNGMKMGFELLAEAAVLSPNPETHALCSSCKGIFEKGDCYECEHCAGYTCEGCAERGCFTCCLQSCLDSAEIEGERILAA